MMNAETKQLEEETSNGSSVGIGMLGLFFLLVLLHVPAYLHFIAEKFFDSNMIKRMAEKTGVLDLLVFLYSFTLSWLFK